MLKTENRFSFLVLMFLAFCGQLHAADGRLVVLNDDGGWCWFEDERALVIGNKLVVGTVANGAHESSRKGDIDAVTYNFATGKISRSTLHKNLEADDHDSPAFLERPDGRILALYCKHNPENKIHYRVTRNPGDGSSWQDERIFVPSAESRVTYSNPHWLKKENGGKGRIYNFFRGYNNTFKPSWMFSDDLGETWTAGGVLIDFKDKIRQRPYVKYASNGKDTVHFLFTEAHPRNYDNSIYHAFLRDGKLHRSDGVVIQSLADGPILPAQATKVFSGDSMNVAWTQDMELDARGRPRIVYSVQKDSGGLQPGVGGIDHRYRFAHWDGKRWHDSEIAYAGSKYTPAKTIIRAVFVCTLMTRIPFSFPLMLILLLERRPAPGIMKFIVAGHAMEASHGNGPP